MSRSGCLKIREFPNKKCPEFKWTPYCYICLCIGPGPGRAHVDVWIGENLLLPVVMRRKWIYPTKRAANLRIQTRWMLTSELGSLSPMYGLPSCRLCMLKFRYKRAVKHLSNEKRAPGWLGKKRGWLFILPNYISGIISYAMKYPPGN